MNRFGSRHGLGLLILLFATTTQGASPPDRFIVEAPYATVPDCDLEAPTFATRLETQTGIPYSTTCVLYKAANFPDTMLIVFVAASPGSVVHPRKNIVEGRDTQVMATEIRWEFDEHDQIMPLYGMTVKKVTLPFNDLKDCESYRTQTLTQTSDIFAAICVPRANSPALITYSK